MKLDDPLGGNISSYADLHESELVPIAKKGDKRPRPENFTEQGPPSPNLGEGGNPVEIYHRVVKGGRVE